MNSSYKTVVTFLIYRLLIKLGFLDHSHLAWILRDNRHLLKIMNDASASPSCSDGTLIWHLKLKWFGDCVFNNNGNTINETWHEISSLFYFMRRSPYSTLGTTIPFEIERFNTDDFVELLNLTKCVFTAPDSGIYLFSLSDWKEANALIFFLKKEYCIMI